MYVYIYICIVNHCHQLTTIGHQHGAPVAPLTPGGLRGLRLCQRGRRCAQWLRASPVG